MLNGIEARRLGRACHGLDRSGPLASMSGIIVLLKLNLLGDFCCKTASLMESLHPKFQCRGWMQQKWYEMGWRWCVTLHTKQPLATTLNSEFPLN